MPGAYLSIDFEDISHDFKREHGAAGDGSMRTAALDRAYDAIEGFARDALGGARLTFFTTGVLAEKCPEIVARIARDGHEIACHYFWHDPARLDPPEVFAANLDRAIAALGRASGQPVLGFRAPRFSLGPEDAAHFAVLARRFAYDSSLTAASAAELAAARARLGAPDLALFPVGRTRVAPRLPPVRSGGSYLKLFPAAVTLAALRRTVAAGVLPMVYLHPYEFVADRSFQVPMAEMTGLPRHRRLYWALRQSQWHGVGNRSVAAKLRRIMAEFPPAGPMRSLVSA